MKNEGSNIYICQYSGLKVDTKISGKSNFRSFVLHLLFDMLLLVVLFTIKLLSQLNMIKNFLVVDQSIGNELKEQSCGFLCLLFGTSCPSLLGNMLMLFNVNVSTLYAAGNLPIE